MKQDDIRLVGIQPSSDAVPDLVCPPATMSFMVAVEVLGRSVGLASNKINVVAVIEKQLVKRPSIADNAGAAGPISNGIAQRHDSNGIGRFAPSR